MNTFFRRVLSIASFMLTTSLVGGSVAPLVATAVGNESNETPMIVNDSRQSDETFSFSYSGEWAYDSGYGSRFQEGDEHWINSSKFGETYPSFTFRFIGSQVAFYGHKVPSGAMADVTVDGVTVGRIDYYNADRIERTLLWESEVLAYGEHSVTVQLIEGGNPEAENGQEASIDYAVVMTHETIPVTAIKVDVESILLEPTMTYTIDYKLYPVYATETPTIHFSSSDPSVATVDANGTVTAIAPGEVTLTLTSSSGNCNETVKIKVREAVGGDFVVLAGSTNDHVRQDQYHTRLASLKLDETTLSMTAWRADIATAKIDLLTKNHARTGIHAEVGTLSNASGDILAAEISVLPVRDTLAHDTGHLVPDVIGGASTLDLPACSVGSLWIRLETPADALPGVYTAPVTVSNSEGDTAVLSLSVEVIGLTRPQNTVALELWQYPYSSNRYYSGKTTEEYFGEGLDGIWHTHLDTAYEDALRSQVELYASAGGKTVTVTVSEDPWNSQTPDPYPSMIKWTRELDGSFSFDYTDFDYWVNLNAACGVDGPIQSFSIGEWTNRVTYYDMATQAVTSEHLSPGSERWIEVWTAFLTDYMAHTTARGWFDRVYMAMDERPADIVELVLDLVESVRNEKGQCFKTSLAVFTFDTEYMFDRVTDLSLAIYMTPKRVQKIAEHRRELGLTTTLYTCGAQYSALENSPYESLYTIWFCEKMGTDGFLRWALDAFNDEPLISSAHRLFAAGDIYLFYPDEKNTENPTARTSPRFEKLAEGCRDVSKLRYLSNLSAYYTEQTDGILSKLRSVALEDDVTRAQTALNKLARRAALEEAILVAEGADSEGAVNLTQMIADAKLLLEADDPADADLQRMTYALLTIASASNETEPESETSNEVVTGAIITTPAEETTDTDKPSAGCASAMASATLGLTTAGAAALVAKKKKSRDDA